MVESGIVSRGPERRVSLRTLDGLALAAARTDGVWARDVSAGDWIVIRTRNSVYALSAVGDGTFIVSGGWFSTHGSDGVTVAIAGCTWGGHALLTGMIAAPGMFLEFANGVRTTRIREVRSFRGAHGTH